MSKTILFLAANPKDTPPLRLDQEARDIEHGLQRAKRRDEFNFKQVWAARPVDVRRAMLDLKPNIVHFCGHGVDEEGLAFENELGKTKLVTSKALAGLFELFSKDLTCVVLNACYSEDQANAVVEHVDYVIGMNRAIGDAAAVEFSVAFYDAIGAGYSIEFAYKVGCNALQFLEISESHTPVLKKKLVPEEKITSPQTSLLDSSDIRDTEKLFKYMSSLFMSWTASGFLREDAEKHKYLLSAFGNLVERYGTDSIDHVFHGWMDEIKKVAAQALEMPKSKMDWLEFDFSGPFENLSVEDCFLRLWRAAQAKREVSNMAAIRLAMVVVLGEERQSELIAVWNR